MAIPHVLAHEHKDNVAVVVVEGVTKGTKMLGVVTADALSLTPALCATLLKQVPAGHHEEKRGFFGAFNRFFQRTAHGYEGVVARILKRAGRAMIVYGLIAAVVALMFLLNRKFADMAVFMLAALIVGGFVMAPNDVADLVKDIWTTITGSDG